MKAWQYLVTVVLGAACVILACRVIWTGRTNQGLQGELQQQQATLQQIQVEINNTQRVMQMGNSILQDMVIVAARSDKMHKLLANNGYNIQFQAAPPAAANGTSTSKKGGTP